MSIVIFTDYLAMQFFLDNIKGEIKIQLWNFVAGLLPRALTMFQVSFLSDFGQIYVHLLRLKDHFFLLLVFQTPLNNLDFKTTKSFFEA